MEQRILGWSRQPPEEQTRQLREERSAEGERTGLPGLLARAALESVSLLEMPPAGLEELAALLGNQGMKELLERQALPVEEARLPPLFGVETVPFPVPEGSPPPTAPFPGPPAEEYGGRAFDPAALTE